MLKIGQPRNAYEALGLPRSATSVQVRTRYRQLVRSYRRELSTEELLKDERFRQWANSFLLLTGGERREYDQRLRASRGREQPGDKLGELGEARRMLVEAEAAFLRRKLKEATDLAKEALKQETRNAAGYALLGDVLREQERYNDALTMYNYAIQFEPSDQRYWQRLREITALRQGRALPRRYRRELSTPMNRPLWVWLVVGLATLLVELSMMQLWGRWGKTWFLNIPTNLIYVAMCDGFAMGLVLAATAVLGPFDDELVWYQVAGVGGETLPIGLLVVGPGILFFWVGVVFYAIIAALDEHVSLSVVIALALCGVMAVGLGLLAPENARQAIYLVGGNFVFAGFLVGWLVGSIRLRVFEH
jgi:tetratricopeptide (TPR) repeat protein